MSYHQRKAIPGKKHNQYSSKQGKGERQITNYATVSHSSPGECNRGRSSAGSQPKHAFENSGLSGRGYSQDQQVDMAGVVCDQSLGTDTENERVTLESGNSNSAQNVGNQASGIQVEHSGQSVSSCIDKDLPTKSSVTVDFEMSDIYACDKCKHHNVLWKDIIDTHQNREYYIQKLKEQRIAHTVKCDEPEHRTSGLSAYAVEFVQKPHIESRLKDSSQNWNIEASSSLLSVQSSLDTATNNSLHDWFENDNKMDTCDAVERKGSLGYSPHEGEGDHFDDRQHGNDERGRKGDRQQMNKRRDQSNHSRERRANDYPSWRGEGNRNQPHIANNRGGRGGSMRYDHTNYKIVKEVDGDLFEAPKEYSLAHCVATDMRMGSGIAVNFRQTFKSVPELLQQRARVGQIAVLEQEDRFIYYLVTKKYSNGKPTLDDLISSLEKVRDHCAEHGVKLLAMPRIGCGLDRLEWRHVKPKIEEVFSGLDISITVYNFNQLEKEDSHYSKSKRSLPVKHVRHPLVDIETETALIFFGSEDGGVDESGTDLDHKYNFLLEFRKKPKVVGDVIRFIKKKEVLYGLIVRKKQDDEFSYIHFEKCLYELRKHVKKDEFVFVGVQAFCTDDDPLTMEKIISVMKNVLTAPGLELYVCWPKDLAQCHRWNEEI